MHIKMVKRQCNYWNRLVDLYDNSLLHKATKEQLVWLNNISSKDKRCWLNVTSEALKTYRIYIPHTFTPHQVACDILYAPDGDHDAVVLTLRPIHPPASPYRKPGDRPIPHHLPSSPILAPHSRHGLNELTHTVSHSHTPLSFHGGPACNKTSPNFVDHSLICKTNTPITNVLSCHKHNCH